MSSVSKSKTKSEDRRTSSGVKDQVKDSSTVKPAISTSGALHRLEKAVDDSDAHSGSSGTCPEYDTISNNGSYSGESEDLKEKTVSNIVDFEKREKIRLRNEKKHQRQRERRAQELRERCCSFLMSRKMEALTRQLVSMGFTSDQATAALMMNDGKLEESVSWLLEGNTEASKKATILSGGCSLKIDISGELAQVAAMEKRHNCATKEVERAVVASEGDLHKAEKMLHEQKQEMSHSISNNDAVLPPGKPPVTQDSMQQRRTKRDLNYPAAAQAATTESVGNYQQLLLRPSANVVDARPSKTGYGANNIQQSSARDPQIVMQQRPQTTGSTSGSYLLSNPGYGSFVAGQLNQNLHPQQSHYRADYRHQDQLVTSKMQLGSSGSRNPMTPSRTLNVPSSLGLFSGRASGSSGSSSSHVDWNHLDWYRQGQMPLCDYTSIDWTMDSSPLSKSSNAQLVGLGLSSIWKNDGNGEAMSGFSEGGSHEWTSPFGGRDMFNAPRQFVNSSSLW